ncbi:MAG: TRAP transporter substrate-binding protein [Proteobacteria bacterium]|nr:TRAP transporter substrate-binding protein [Pseudomonadota bacterium]MDA1331727.1 TRAP transporter substrate-binding protein [Pseudomonadota bacterium]
MIKFRAVLALGLVGLFVLAGCGGDGDGVVNTTSKGGEGSKKVNLKMASAFVGSLPLLGVAAVDWTKKVDSVSGGTLDIDFFEPNALVPGLEAIPAASKGSVDMAWASSGYFQGINTVFSMFTTLPFGANATEFLAWYYYGDGSKFADELYGAHNIKYIPCHMIPPEASGWFKKEIKNLNDLKGLKMRFFGLGAKVMEKLGVSTQLLAGGEIYQALQLGTIDATEFAMPSVDQGMGLYQVAKHYYFPGWHQPASFNGVFINLPVWNSLSKQHQAIIEVSCGDTIRDGLALGEFSQPAAIDKMVKQGVKVHYWKPEFLAAFKGAWDEVAAEESAVNPEFKRVYENYVAFRKQFATWRDLGYLK